MQATLVPTKHILFLYPILFFTLLLFKLNTIMEDLKNRLKFSDVSVRSRCLQKLVQVVKKKTKGELITSSSTHIPELSLIWETCLHESSSTSNLAVRGVIYLVTNKHLEVTFAVNNLLSSLSSASNVYGIMKGITRLLMHQSAAIAGDNSALYSLNQPKHPLISVLQANEDFLPLVLENIADVISEDNLGGFKVMEPVICYILSDPLRRRTNGSKVLLIETLIETVKNEPKTAFYILRCVPFLQVQDCHQVIEATNFVLRANAAFSSMRCEEDDTVYISELLLLSSLFLSERCVAFGHDPTRLLKLALDTAGSLLQINRKPLYINPCLVSIAMILKNTTGELVELYSNLALSLLDFDQVSSTAAAFLAFTVLQLLPEPSVISFSDTSMPLMSQLLAKCERCFSIRPSTSESSSTNLNDCAAFGSSSSKVDQPSLMVFSVQALTFSAECCFQCAKFAVTLDELSDGQRQDWIDSIKSSVVHCSSQNLDVIFSLVASLFLLADDNYEYLNTCLDALEVIIQENTNLSTKVFALLLYKQGLVKSPESKILILSFLPKSSTHKYSIPPVLSIIKMMANDPELKPHAIQLMLQLWKKHDRCFQYLHKLLLENNKSFNKELGLNETLISQTSAIREICLISPEKHGLELVNILSKILNESVDETSSPAACLALDGVIHLCKSEVADLRSTWKMLGPNLSKDKRKQVMCWMFKFLSLVPTLQVKSPEYDQFMSDTAANIWKRICSDSLPPEAVSEAFKTLAKFPLDCYTLKQLPQAARANLQLPASMKATPFEMGKLPEDVLPYTPGYCYIDLLQSIEDSVILKGYTEFLSSVIKQEIADLPRSVYSQRKHLQKRQNVCKALTDVPKFLCSHFESKKAPTLQKNMAVGVLLCFEPPLELGKDGEPIKRSLASQYRFYEQVLSVLLNEVNIDTTEWQRCILLPGAWGAFMERAFFMCEESRRAELEMQKSLGHRDFTPEDFNLQCKCAWLWVRDRMLNAIKTSVKNAPTSHANAVLAIAGLVHASNKFHASLDDNAKLLSDSNENHISHHCFLAECTETILCAMISDYHPSGNVHSWLLTHLSRPNSSAGFLVQGCSCASLCHLATILVSSFADKISDVFETLRIYVTHSSPVLSFYSCLATGLLIKSLCEVGYPDMGDCQMEIILENAKAICKFSSNDESSTCALIGLTIAVASLSNVTHEECKDWISTTVNLFHEKLMEEDVKSMNFESLSISVSAMMICAVDGNCMPIDNLYNLAVWFEEKQATLPQCSGISVSSGILMEALERIKHSQAAEIKQKLQKEWFNTLTSEKKPTLHRIAALNGLCSLYSRGRGLIQYRTQEDADVSAVNDLVSIMFQLLTAGRDMGLQNICSWESGRLYSVHSYQQETEAAVPSSYSYLGEKSVLKPLFKAILLSNESTNKDSDVASYHILAALDALQGEFPKPLPPLNWNAILTPLMQQHQNLSTQETILNVALCRAKSSTYAVHFLSPYCCPPLYHTLAESSQFFLLKKMAALSEVLPTQKLKVFLQTVISPILKQEKQFSVLGKIVMQGIQETFTSADLKQQSLSVVQEAFVTMFRHFKNDHALLRKHLTWISQMLSHLPNKAVDSLLSVTSNGHDVAALTALACHLVRTNKKSLSFLKMYVDVGKRSSQLEKEQICTSIYHCFLNGSSCGKSEVNLPEKCISWLLETIGWINVLDDSKSQYQLEEITEDFHFLNDVCFATIIGCAGIVCSYNLLTTQRLNHQQLLENIPIAITRLSENSDWSETIDKIIHWLLLLLRSSHTCDSDKYFVKLSLCGLRSSGEFRKLHIWTDVMSSIY